MFSLFFTAFISEESQTSSEVMALFGSVQRLAGLASIGRAKLSTSALRLGGGHGWSYRTTPPPTSKNLALGSKVIMTFTWWWIFHGKSLLSTLYRVDVVYTV